MQQENLTKTANSPFVRHGGSHVPSTLSWVFDSKPLEPGKHNVEVFRMGCDACSGCWQPAPSK